MQRFSTAKHFQVVFICDLVVQSMSASRELGCMKTCSVLFALWEYCPISIVKQKALCSCL